jgi:hypothetical protein
VVHKRGRICHWQLVTSRTRKPCGILLGTWSATDRMARICFDCALQQSCVSFQHAAMRRRRPSGTGVLCSEPLRHELQQRRDQVHKVPAWHRLRVPHRQPLLCWPPQLRHGTCAPVLCCRLAAGNEMPAIAHSRRPSLLAPCVNCSAKQDSYSLSAVNCQLRVRQ